MPLIKKQYDRTIKLQLSMRLHESAAFVFQCKTAFLFSFCMYVCFAISYNLVCLKHTGAKAISTGPIFDRY